MKLLPYSRTWPQRALIVSLIVMGTSSITYQLLYAQDTNASLGVPSPTVMNSTTAPASTNAAPVAPAPSDATNAPAPEDMTGQPGAIPEGSPQEGTNAPAALEGMPQENPAVQDISSPSGSNAVESLNQGIPNSPAVQDVTNQQDFWDSFWQQRSPLHLGLDVGEMYDDNILISPQKTSSFLTHISPNIDFQKGDQTAPHMNYLNLYFAPTIYLYQDHSNYNRADYNADIYYQYTWTRLTLAFEQNYQHLTDANLDVGSLVSRNIYTTKLTANYVYDDDLSLYEAATQQVNNYPGLTINEWDLDNYALYRVAPKLLMGAGPRFCFLDITGAPNEAHQDLLFRLKYTPDRKISVAFDGGVEYLQYQDNTPSRVFPIFDCNANYAPFDGTGLFVYAYRATVNSYDIQGDTIAYTSVQGGASQQFLRDIKFTFSVGYNMSDYNESSGQLQNSIRRKDDYYFAKGGVEWDPKVWLKFEATYQWSENHSTFAENTFNDNQINLQSSIKF